MRFPVDFEEIAKRPRGTTGADYPYAIKASDLMKNFIFAALDLDDSLFDTTSGQNGHTQRRLKIPALPEDVTPRNLTATGGSLGWTPGIPEPPATGTYVLGAVNGTLQWIATEEC